MEIREKLNIFHTSAIEVANRQRNDMLLESSITMENIQKEYIKNITEEMESRYRNEEGKMKRHMKRCISMNVIEQKRRLNLYQQNKKDVLFQAVSRNLKEFQKTEDYIKYLTIKIRMAKDFAQQEKINIYLDPTDEGKKSFLEQETGCTLFVSKICFGGGIRAVIYKKNVLFDESFDTKLGQEKDAYIFE